MLGYSREDYIGHSIREFHTDSAVIDDILLRLRRGETVREYEAPLRCKDGSIRHAVLDSSVLFENGAFVHTRCFTRDITDRKRAEEALKDADRRKDDFLAMLGHELRNPLGVISMAVQLLRMNGAADPAVEELRETIEFEVSQLARLLDDLLDVSRIARGLIRLKKEPCDLTMIVRQVAEGRRSIVDNRLDLRVDLPSRPIWVMADRTRLTQVVGNLLDNAIKFTDRGGEVTIGLTVSAESTSLKIRDTGIGIEPHTLERIFDPFIQADRSMDRSRGGLGLGLALVRGLVDLHGGKVIARSAGAGRGAEFAVQLPLGDEPEPVLEQAAPADILTPHRRILVIEDNVNAAQSLRQFLTAIGHQVEVAHSGSDGVEMVRRLRPEVVLCDIGLPELDGYGVARWVRQEPELTGICLIAVSGYGQEADQRRALDVGFDAYLIKPIDFNELKRLLAVTRP